MLKCQNNYFKQIVRILLISTSVIQTSCSIMHQRLNEEVLNQRKLNFLNL